MVAVLKSPTASAEGKTAAAWAFWSLMQNPLPGGSPSDAAKLHPAAQSAVEPLVATLQLDSINSTAPCSKQWVPAAWTIDVLARDCPPNQSLGLIGAEPCVISRLWQLSLDRYFLWPALAALCAGHGMNQSRLMSQDGFVENLMKLPERRIRDDNYFRWIECIDTALALFEDNPEFVLMLCNTSAAAAVPVLTAALDVPEGWSQHGAIKRILQLLLSMSKADPPSSPSAVS